jgi:hypothetical protein
MPYSSLWLVWKYAVLVAGCFALAGAIWAIRHKLVALPLAYSAFLGAFLMTAIVTHKSIIKMPNDYYLGISAPLLVILIWLGAQAVPIASPILAAVIILGAATATPIMSYGDFRKMLAEIRSDCDRCAVVVGWGYGGAVPACVLYEAKGLDIHLLKSSDTLEGVDRQIGRNRVIYLIPSQDPPTKSIEDRLIESHSATPRNGYFRIEPLH